ncbi:GAF domain-containing protein [Streptomyces klenkii]|uniref:GAF domain-containing protein n=1 Tax=Streptomyces klenkii TaxID=1420899 RepID=UPI0033AA158E
MNPPEELVTTLALAGSPTGHQAVLRSVVDTARGVFGARAASITGFDAATNELVFEAVSGEGEDFLVGERFSAGRGIAGWVLMSAEPMVVDDLTDHTVFDRALAESTRYVPKALMAAPLVHGDRVLGVLEVLDRDRGQRSALRDLDWLGLFAAQAAHALALVRQARTARRVLHGEESAELAEVMEVIRAYGALPADRRAAGRTLMQALAGALRATP